MRCLPPPFLDGNNGRFFSAVPYCSRCQLTRASIAREPSVFTGTARETSPPLTMLLSKSKSDTDRPFCQTSPICRLSSSEMRPPVETPSRNKPRLRTSNVPVKQAETSRISLLSRGLVPFIVCLQFLFSACVFDKTCVV